MIGFSVEYCTISSDNELKTGWTIRQSIVHNQTIISPKSPLKSPGDFPHWHSHLGLGVR